MPQRLDAENGLLLSANWDAALDAGLVSFDDEGRTIGKTALDPLARAALDVEAAGLYRLNDRLRGQLAWHRERFGF
jgi:predicted restriction endonuclease